MSDLHLTEEEQVERLKKWWKENGTSIIVGIVIGIAAVVGYIQWNKYQDTRSAGASIEYDRFVTASGAKKTDEAQANLQKLKAEYQGTTYAALASLIDAAQLINNNHSDEAIASLKWAYENPGHETIKHLARIRLATLYIAKDQPGEALALIDKVSDPAFDADYAVLRGDIYRKQGQPEKARTEYQLALAAKGFSGKQREYVQMKLDDLGLVSSTAEVAN